MSEEEKHVSSGVADAIEQAESIMQKIKDQSGEQMFGCCFCDDGVFWKDGATLSLELPPDGNNQRKQQVLFCHMECLGKTLGSVKYYGPIREWFGYDEDEAEWEKIE